MAGIKDGEVRSLLPVLTAIFTYLTDCAVKGSVIGPTSLLWDTNYDKKPAYFGVEMALDE